MTNKKLNSFFAYILLAVSFSACDSSDSRVPTTPSKFIVTRIQPNTKTTSTYLVEPIEKQDLNMSSTWIVDSVGKFNAGDTLSFQHYR
tara:strand:- start:28 stop:291 length:264 start_codon:yes stop_codon:yes gene_type:complete